MEKHNPAKFRSKKNSSRSNKIFFQHYHLCLMGE